MKQPAFLGNPWQGKSENLEGGGWVSKVTQQALQGSACAPGGLGAPGFSFLLWLVVGHSR